MAYSRRRLYKYYLLYRYINLRRSFERAKELHIGLGRCLPKRESRGGREREERRRREEVSLQT